MSWSAAAACLVPKLAGVGSAYANRLVTGCAPPPGSGLPDARYVGVSSSYANRSVTSCVPAPGSGLPGAGYVGSAFRMRTGRSPAVSRQRQAWSRSWWDQHFICEPVGHRLCPGTRQRPAWSRSSRGRQLMHGPLRFGPATGPSRRGCPGSGVSASAPTAPVTIIISFCTPSGPGSDPRARRKYSPQFPRFRRQPGKLLFPPCYLPHRTVPDSSSNFWCNPTTFVVSPPLHRKENPRSRAPSCSGDGADKQDTLVFITFII